MHSQPFTQRKLIILGAIGVILIVLAWWRYSEWFPSTDDAYVQANIVMVAPQITGSVQSVAVNDHQTVHAGQLLFTIDPQPFQTALAKAQAAYDLAKQQVAVDQASVASAQALVQQRQVEAINAKQNGQRSLLLAAKGVVSRREADDAKASIADSQAVLAGSQAQLRQAEAQLGVLGAANARLLQAKAAVADAQLSLSYTRVFASVDGVVENVSLRVGNVVTAADAVFSLIDEKQWWVEANFKETQLARIKPGQAVSVELDMYPGHDFKGVVESIAAGSGAIFSLLPPENATGNWVKVTQRFPVRIRLTKDPHYPFRAGASAWVRINTLSGPA